MKRYFRPLGILSGSAAREAVAAGLALPLAGGPLAFALVEVIERGGVCINRRLMSVADFMSSSPLEGEGGPQGRAGGDADAFSLMSERRRHYPSPDAASRHPPPPQGGRGDESGVRVMGIVNATPDSFSDGGRYFDAARAIAHAEAMIAAGAAILDIGGESTRPGALSVHPDEEIRRIIPVIAGVRALADAAGVLISVDTRNAATMRAALAAGAGMINDVSALTHDPAALGVVASSDALVVLMHMQGNPGSMQVSPSYADVALDVYDYLESRIAACEAAGIDRSRIIADPGIGFGKTVRHNLELLDSLSLFHGLGVPLLVGVSRKGFIAHLSAGEPPEQRLSGSIAAGLAAIGQGAGVLRVHDVPETLQAVHMAMALRGV